MGVRFEAFKTSDQLDQRWKGKNLG